MTDYTVLQIEDERGKMESVNDTLNRMMEEGTQVTGLKLHDTGYVRLVDIPGPGGDKCCIKTCKNDAPYHAHITDSRTGVAAKVCEKH